MSEKLISIKGLDKAVVFATLYNLARLQGMGFMHHDPEPMTVKEAKTMLRDVGPDWLYFDYVRGHVMKIDIGGDEVDPWLFDRDNGSGAAAEAIASIRDCSIPNDQ